MGALALDRDPQVRLSAIRALGQIGAPAHPALPALSDALTDADSEVRSEAAKSVEKIRALR